MRDLLTAREEHEWFGPGELTPVSDGNQVLKPAPMVRHAPRRWVAVCSACWPFPADQEFEEITVSHGLASCFVCGGRVDIHGHWYDLRRNRTPIEAVEN